MASYVNCDKYFKYGSVQKLQRGNSKYFLVFLEESMNKYDTTSFPWASLISFLHTHILYFNIRYLLRQHHAVMQTNQRQSIHTTHNTITLHIQICSIQLHVSSNNFDNHQTETICKYKRKIALEGLLYLWSKWLPETCSGIEQIRMCHGYSVVCCVDWLLLSSYVQVGQTMSLAIT
jgi:hypothetical protein